MEAASQTFKQPYVIQGHPFSSLLHLQLPDSADLFELAGTCAAYVSVLVETDDAVTFATLCKQLLGC
ncbi:hypothetical protein AXA52_11945 [Enterobacter hormaechei]|nr:hypothetical protein AXA52_11945 [Enterobacter hormaechei]